MLSKPLKGSVRSAMALGPMRYRWAIVLGLVVGTVGFLLFGQEAKKHPLHDQYLTLAGYAAAGAFICMLGAMVANYRIGRKIQNYQP